MKKIILLLALALLMGCSFTKGTAPDDQAGTVEDQHSARNSLDYFGTYRPAGSPVDDSGISSVQIIDEKKYSSVLYDGTRYTGNYRWNATGYVIQLIGKNGFVDFEFFVSEDEIKDTRTGELYYKQTDKPKPKKPAPKATQATAAARAPEKHSANTGLVMPAGQPGAQATPSPKIEAPTQPRVTAQADTAAPAPTANAKQVKASAQGAETLQAAPAAQTAQTPKAAPKTPAAAVANVEATAAGNAHNAMLSLDYFGIYRPAGTKAFDNEIATIEIVDDINYITTLNNGSRKTGKFMWDATGSVIQLFRQNGYVDYSFFVGENFITDRRTGETYYKQLSESEQKKQDELAAAKKKESTAAAQGPKTYAAHSAVNSLDYFGLYRPIGTMADDSELASVEIIDKNTYATTLYDGSRETGKFSWDDSGSVVNFIGKNGYVSFQFFVGENFIRDNRTGKTYYKPAALEQKNTQKSNTKNNVQAATEQTATTYSAHSAVTSLDYFGDYRPAGAQDDDSQLTLVQIIDEKTYSLRHYGGARETGKFTWDESGSIISLINKNGYVAFKFFVGENFIKDTRTGTTYYNQNK